MQARDSKSGTIVALKMYRMHKLNDISSHQVAREVRLHVALQHENIIGLYAAWQEAGNVVLLQASHRGVAGLNCLAIGEHTAHGGRCSVHLCA
jgi:aurora kinase